MKKTIGIILAVLMLTALCACGIGEDVDCIYFQNDTGAKIHGLHITSASSDSWGDPLNYADISVGSKIIVDMEKLTEGPGVYDVGAIDENGMNYDVYEVTLNIDDTIRLSAEDDTAILIVTSADGGSETYYGLAYPQED